MGDFRKLKVWVEAKDISVEIYRLTEKGQFTRDFRFRDQIRAAAISIASNIAEGEELMTTKQAIRHFYIAKGSLAEVLTQLIIASELEYIPLPKFEELEKRLTHLSVMLNNLIKYRQKNNLH